MEHVRLLVPLDGDVVDDRTKTHEPHLDVVRTIGKVVNPESSGGIRLGAGDDAAVARDDDITADQSLTPGAVANDSGEIAGGCGAPVTEPGSRRMGGRGSGQRRRHDESVHRDLRCM